MWYNSRIMVGLIKLGAALAVLLLATAIAGPGAAFAAEDAAKVLRKYPPYPDVWGRELPFPDDGSYYISAKAYEMPDGEIRFHVAWNKRRSDKPLRFFLFDFFTKLSQEIDKKTEYSFRRKNGNRQRLDFNLTLPDGSSIKNKSEMFSNCRETWDLHIVKRDPSGRIVADKMLLALYDRPVRIEVMRRCALSNGAGHFFAKWRQLDVAFANLRDGTFLAYPDKAGFIIRFRTDLTSPYIDAHRKLYLVNRPEIMKVVKKALRRPGLPLQNVNDAVYQYLLKLKEETKR